MKMPEPIAAQYRVFDDRRWSDWREMQIEVAKQRYAEHVEVRFLYDKQALIDLLEEAAKECERNWINTAEKLYGQDCAAAFRKLKETL